MSSREDSVPESFDALVDGEASSADGQTKAHKDGLPWGMILKMGIGLLIAFVLGYTAFAVWNETHTSSPADPPSSGSVFNVVLATGQPSDVDGSATYTDFEEISARL